MENPPLYNRPFDQLTIGETASLVRVAGQGDIDLFAAVSGDFNPAHVDAGFASSDFFGHVVVHGMWTGALISAVLGTQLPGPGTIYLGQELQFRRPVVPGDTITASVTVKEKRADQRIVFLDTQCSNQRGEIVLAGTATVIAPAKLIAWQAKPRPEVSIHRHDRYDPLVQKARDMPLLRTAIVHPCSPEALSAALEARREGLLDPILIGPRAKIQAAAQAAKEDLSGIDIAAVEHSHAAAALAAQWGAGGQVAALMKGSLHTDELLSAVLSTPGLRTARRISHLYAMDVPSYHKLLFVTDAAVNMAPTLEEKRDIVQNAVDFLHVLGISEPRVAVLAAVETVNFRMPSTLDAAALTVMAARGQLTGALVDGPMAFDTAISASAAELKGLISTVAGQADILLAPDLDAGNLLAKQLTYLADADAAGVVLGARIPIILTSRSDSVRVRLASAALAKLMAQKMP